jgi:hypothetical protein
MEITSHKLMINVLQIVNILAHIEFKYVLGVGGGD